MTLIAVVTFGLSLLGLIALFGLKFLEERNETRFAPSLRTKADEEAIYLKRKIQRLGNLAEDLPHYSFLVTRVILHAVVVGFAKIAGAAEKGAHQVADLVSHKRRFEHRETSSDFLKQVSEHKNDMNGNGQPAVKKKAVRKRVVKKPVRAQRAGERLGKKKE
jgi:hypothetical protein